MRVWEIFLIGVGLSMDAFAVAVCRGLTLRRPSPKQTLSVALWFGGFQALMPLLGYSLGAEFGRRLDGVDHILACLILSLIGCNMIREGHSHDPAPAKATGKASALEKSGAFSLFLLAVATSIDAFAVGISFGVMGGVPIMRAAILIGVTTASLSAAGLTIGALFGEKAKTRAEMVGGVLLILIGIKILFEGFVKQGAF
ncbi:MAG: manganese efflux pump [Clostridia bacterium]|nr:manganese efflux pump [Clostridia bacterium]MBR5043738.1 manganese efflux pump [Clostridia bacterium]